MRRGTSSVRSRAKPAPKVKVPLAILPVLAAALVLVPPLPSRAAETESEATDQPSIKIDPAELPDIQARSYGVKVIKRSTSKKTYLFDDITQSVPQVGRIILLKRESENIMAFRVLKTYPDNRQFAARRVRRYGNHKNLIRDESFLAVEKISDIAVGPPSAEEQADLNELEGGSSGGNLPDTQSYDPELDTGSSPPPAGAVDSEDADDDPADDETSSDSITVDEVFPLDVNNHWLTAGFGFVRNNNVGGGSAYFAGGGLRYGLTIGKLIFLSKPKAQDSITLEGGVFFYKVLNFVSNNDAYSVVPLIGTIRYNVLLNEGFGIFIYAGFVQNRVVSASQADDATIALLASNLPAGGGGIIFRVGPNWDARVDLGIDMIGGGLMLRF